MENNNIFSQIKAHSGKLATALLLLLIGTVYYTRLQTQEKATSHQDFLQVKRLMDHFYAHEPLSKEELEALEIIFSRHPELVAQYEGSLALSLLPLDKTTPYLQHQIEKAHQLSLYPYEEFLQNALLININKAEALNKSQELETKLTSSNSLEYEKLRLLNLLRIAFLAEELHEQTTLHTTLATLEQLPAYPEYASLFEIRDLHLQDFFSKKS